MKKRLLLLFVAVVCLSPSVVFADLSENSYVGTSTTMWTRDPSSVGGIVSEKGCASCIGSFQRMPPPTTQSAAPVGSASNCTAKQKEIKDTNDFLKQNGRPSAGDANG